jgi:hypothetical protein
VDGWGGIFLSFASAAGDGPTNGVPSGGVLLKLAGHRERKKSGWKVGDVFYFQSLPSLSILNLLERM